VTVPTKFVSFFADEGYVRNVPAEMELRGQDIALAAGGMATAISDVYPEIFSIYAMDGVIVVELAIRGWHTGLLATLSGTLPPTGDVVDVPWCYVFHVDKGKGCLLPLPQRGVHHAAVGSVQLKGGNIPSANRDGSLPMHLT